MLKVYDFGKFAINSKRKINRVTVTIELNDTDKGPVFSARGSVYNGSGTDIILGGQCLDDLKARVHNGIFNTIYDLWKKYHLNDMHAGTPKQEKAIRKYLQETHQRYDYDLVCSFLENEGLLIDNGYRYGTSWLYEAIPENDLNRIKALFVD